MSKWPMVLIMALSGALASEFRTGDLTLAADQVVSGDLYFYGQNLTIAGQIEGDLVAIASQITVEGSVNGDLIAVAEQIDVTGAVAESVRAAAGTLNLAGTIGQDLVVAANDLEVTPSGRIAGSLYGAASTMLIAGEVGQELRFTAGDLRLEGRVGQDVVGSANWLELRSDASVGGNLSYHSPNRADIAPTVQIAGESEYLGPSESGFRISLWVIGARAFLGLFIFGLLFLTLRSSLWVRATDLATRSFGTGLLYGLAALLAVPIAAAFLIALGTVVGGWWVGILLLAGLAILAAAGLTVSGSALARRLLRPGQGTALRIAILALGSLIVVVAAMLPVLGPLLFLIALAWGLGTLLSMGLGSSQPPAPRP